MKPMCEANCGRATEVYGNRYCPECHERYTPAREVLDFRPTGEIPQQPGEYILVNPCDGYHVADAVFDDDGFENFLVFGRDVGTNFYIAWAKLPDALERLHPIFVDWQKPDN